MATPAHDLPPARDEPPPRRAMLTAALVATPLAAVAIAWWDPDRAGGPPLCPLRACTGIACPGCGLTRATGALLRGRVGDALHVHPFALALALQVAVVWALACSARGRRALFATPAWLRGMVLGGNVAALLALWVVRLSTGWIDVVS